jgi:hypothetical protein
MIKAPDPRWIPFLKLGLGLILMMTLTILAIVIGLGKVEASSSYGLDIIVGGLLTLAGGFSSWCFEKSKE